MDLHREWTWHITTLQLHTSKPRGACPSWPPIIEGKNPKILSTISWSLITSSFAGLLAKTSVLLCLSSSSFISRVDRCFFKHRIWLSITGTSFWYKEWVQGWKAITKVLWQWGPALLVQCWNVRANVACAKHSQRHISSTGLCSYSYPNRLLVY